MTSGQTRVLVLLIVLFALEIIRYPAIKVWLAGAINGVNGALNQKAPGS